ncbi:MAG: hypothetical protein F6K61_20290 [Sphaerospermopsis sp. SIO1G1]|nr:hypothetical protein [Sphaerospermopsis sp. SIO1G1]
MNRKIENKINKITKPDDKMTIRLLTKKCCNLPLDTTTPSPILEEKSFNNN